MCCVIPWGTEEERARCEAIAREVSHAIVPPRMPLEALGALFQRSRAVLGVDTGLTHLAAALHAPAVGIYCASDPGLTGLHASSRARNLGGIGQPPEPERVIAALAEFL
jgi:heptosyltransferase-1